MRALLLASRPFSWINTCLPYLAAAIAAGHRLSWVAVLGGLYFLIPFNLLMYGVNDLFDYESDRRNPRKGGVEGAILPPAAGRSLSAAVAVTNVPLLAAVWLLAGPLAGLAFCATAFTALAYSAPPLRTKIRPGFDSVTSSLHFTLPAVCGSLVGGSQLPTLPWRFLVAFFLWGIASQALGAMQDVDCDRAAGLRSIATWLGVAPTAGLATVLYTAAAAIVLTAGGGGVLAGLVILPYALLAVSCLGGEEERARLAWRGFLGMNLLSGFVLTQILLRSWGVGPPDTLLVVAWGTGAVAWLALGCAAVGERELARPGLAPGPALSCSAVVVVTQGVPSALVDATLTDLARQRYPGSLETLVVVATRDPDLGGAGQTLRAAAAPPGWSPRCWLYEQGAALARGEVIVFLEAGARLEPAALATLAATVQAQGGGLVSALARPSTPGGRGRCLGVAGLLFQVWRSAPARRSWAATAFTPCLAVGSAGYRSAGAHTSIAGSDCPEGDLARLFARRGMPVALLSGARAGISLDAGSGVRLARRWRAHYYAACGSSLPIALCGLAGPPTLVLLPAALVLAAALRGDWPALLGAAWAMAAVVLLFVLLAWRERLSGRTFLSCPFGLPAAVLVQAQSIWDGIRPSPRQHAGRLAREPIP